MMKRITQRPLKNYSLTRILTNQIPNSHEFIRVNSREIRVDSCQKDFFRALTQILLISLALSLFSPKAFSQDKVVIKSYYPAPIGVYHNLFVTEHIVINRDSPFIPGADTPGDTSDDFRVYVNGRVLLDIDPDPTFGGLVAGVWTNTALVISSARFNNERDVYGGIHFSNTGYRTTNITFNTGEPGSPAGIILFGDFYGAYRDTPDPPDLSFRSCDAVDSHPHLSNIVFAVQDFRNYGRYPAPYSYGPSYRLKYYRGNECADPDLCNDDPLRSRRNRCHNGYYEVGFVTTREIDNGAHDYYVPVNPDKIGDLQYADKPIWRICVRHADPSYELDQAEGAMPLWNERATVPGGFQDDLGNPNIPDL